MPRYFSYSNRLKADYLKKICVWWLKKNGYLELGFEGIMSWENTITKNRSMIRISCWRWVTDQKFIRLKYTIDGEEIDHMALLDSTDCYFGGKRDWFLCQATVDGKFCGRRVGVLYLGSKYFTCRHCLNLTYDSRNLGGYRKKGGSMVTFPDYEEAKQLVKRHYYNGKKTKKFIRFLKLQNKLSRQIG